MKSKRLNVRYSNKMGNLSIIQYGDDTRYPLIVDGQLDDDILDIINRDKIGQAELEKTKHND